MSKMRLRNSIFPLAILLLTETVDEVKLDSPARWDSSWVLPSRRFVWKFSPYNLPSPRWLSGFPPAYVGFVPSGRTPHDPWTIVTRQDVYWKYYSIFRYFRFIPLPSYFISSFFHLILFLFPFQLLLIDSNPLFSQFSPFLSRRYFQTQNPKKNCMIFFAHLSEEYYWPFPSQ